MKRILLFLIILIFIEGESLANNIEQTLSDSLFAKGVELYKKQRYKDAIPLFKESDRIDKALLDSTSNRRDYSSMWLACCLFHLGDTVKAENLYPYYMTEPIDRRETVKVDSLLQSADEQLLNKEYQKAQPLYAQALNFYDSYFVTPHVETAQIAYLTGMCLYLQKNFSSAIPYFEKSLETYNELALSCTRKDQLYVCMRLIESLYSNKMYDKINEPGQQFIQLYTIVKNKGLEFISPFGIIASVAYEQGNMRLAIDGYKQILDILCYNKLENSNDYHQIIDNLSYLCFKNKDYNDAILFSKELYDLNCKRNGENDKSHLPVLRKISASNFFMGNYPDAIKYEEKALILAKLHFGELSEEYATSLLNLSQFQNYNGNYAQAIDNINDNLSILKNNGKEGSVDYAVSLSFLSNYYSNVGHAHKALEFNKVAADIFLKEEGEKSVNYLRSLDNLGIKYSETGDEQKAYETAYKVSELALNLFGENNFEYIKSIANLATHSQNLGKETETDSLYKKALGLISRNLGKQTSQYHTVLSNYAAFKSVCGDFSSAEKLQRESIDIIKGIVGEEHIDYIRSLQALAILNFGKDTNEMVKLADESTRLLKTYMRNQFFRLNVETRRSLWHSPAFNSWYMIMIPAMDYYHSHECKSLGAIDYDAALLSKNYLLNVETEISDIIYKSENAELLNLYEKLKSEENNTPEYKDRLESKLNSLVADNIKNHENLVEWRDVKDSLKENDVAIEFRVAPIRNDSIMYCALVLTKNAEQPILVPLFENKEIRKISPEDYYTTAKVSALVWKPLEKYINGAKNIYFSADAILNIIAIEYMPHWEKDIPISNIWNMYRLSSTSELVKRNVTNRKRYNKVSLFGGIKYDSSLDMLICDSKRYPSNKLVNKERSIADSLNLRGGIAYLPATKDEVNYINALFKGKPINVNVLTDTLATEGYFKTLSGKTTDIIHIATHGFYWTQSEARRMSRLNFLQAGNRNTHRSEGDEALSRSGLLFAGVNNALRGIELPDNVQDGILTAKEISELDLKGLDMVVLSACQTGLGEITGDGVFGLQRGFKKAGANTLLMSLWKVDDRATQMLMTKFYEYLLSGKTKLESLTLAQKYVREYEEEIEISDESNMTASQRRKSQRFEDKSENTNIEKVKVKTFQDPKYWAAFVLLDALN